MSIQVTDPYKNSATPQGTSSGRFQNIRSYLDANAGYNKGQGFAGQVGDTLDEQKQKIDSDVGGESTRVATDVVASAKEYEPETIKTYSKESLADPDKVDMDKWKRLYSGQYTAPKSFDESGTLKTQGQQFTNTVNKLGDETGRKAALRTLYGKPGYSTGQQGLDNILFQTQQVGKPNQLQILQDRTKKQADDLAASYINKKGVADTSISGLAPTIQTVSKQLQQDVGFADAAGNPITTGPYGGAIGSWGTDVLNRVPTDESVAQIIRAVQNGTLPSLTTDLTGNPMHYDDYRSVNSNMNLPDIDMARLAALYKLGGRNYPST